MSETPRVFSFGEYTFDRHTRELRRGGVLVRLQEQPARVLAVLIDHADDLVTREELRRTIWGDDTFVDFNRGLNYCISQIRTALGDSAGGAQSIETLRGRGYRFVGIRNAEPVPPIAGKTERRRAGLSVFQWIATAAVVILAIGSLTFWFVSRSPVRKVAIAPFAASAADRLWADGLHAQVVARLSEQASVSVIDLRQGKTEGLVPWRVEGRIERGMTRHRVTVLLRDMRNGTVRWSDVFDGPRQPSAQDELAEVITMVVGGHLDGNPPMKRRATQSPAGGRFRSEK
jgi:DNA-binding winged helix-turn-helix (wHTH) protein/TolB-like protein